MIRKDIGAQQMSKPRETVKPNETLDWLVKDSTRKQALRRYLISLSTPREDNRKPCECGEMQAENNGNCWECFRPIE